MPGIRAAGVVAALSSAVWFGFFLTEPYNQLVISDRADIETAVLLMLVGVAVSEVALAHIVAGRTSAAERVANLP